LGHSDIATVAREVKRGLAIDNTIDLGTIVHKRREDAKTSFTISILILRVTKKERQRVSEKEQSG
jgi:hypothetical protein